METILGNRRRFWPILVLLVAAGLAISAGVYVFYAVSVSSLRNEALLQQAERAREVANRLEVHLLVSEQLAKTVGTLVAPLRDSKSPVEHLLQGSLKSSSPETVWGVGAWFEPYRFRKGERFFGPYVHRSRKAGESAVLTYEWSADTYNFHDQSWYRSAKEEAPETVFTEPYFDTDLVYMSVASSFQDVSGRFLGVVTVDMVLPQLREIIELANIYEGEVIYVTTAKGNLFAHPDETGILAWMRDSGRKPTSLLDISEDELAAFVRSYAGEKKHSFGNRSEVLMPVLKTGWNVHVSSDKDFLFVNASKFRYISFAVVLLVWLSIGGITWMLRRMLLVVALEQEMKERQRQQVENEKLEAQLRQTQKLESIGTLAAGVAHEINNPMMSVMNYADLILEEVPAGGAAHAHAERIVKLSKRITTIVRHLLTFSRQEQEQHSPADIRKIIEGTLALTDSLLKKEHIQVGIEIPDGIPPFQCRSQQLQQVILNLINNARDSLLERFPGYDPEKKIRIAVSGMAVEGKPWLRITVEDRGKGIPPEIAGRIFDPFFTTKPKDRGTGLGLSISHGIIQKHDGKLWVECAPGQPTRFHIELPMITSGTSDVPPKDLV